MRVLAFLLLAGIYLISCNEPEPFNQFSTNEVQWMLAADTGKVWVRTTRFLEGEIVNPQNCDPQTIVVISANNRADSSFLRQNLFNAGCEENYFEKVGSWFLADEATLGTVSFLDTSYYDIIEILPTMVSFSFIEFDTVMREGNEVIVANDVVEEYEMFFPQ